MSLNFADVAFRSRYASVLHVVKTYYMGPPALLPIRRKVCCGPFIAIKNPSPRPGLNPRPVGPVASTLTTTPPRGLDRVISE
jgi:hypothetical protein